jgi:hypothetical protein
MRFPAQTRESPHFGASTRAIVKHFWSVLTARLVTARVRPLGVGLEQMDDGGAMVLALASITAKAKIARPSRHRDHVESKLGQGASAARSCQTIGLAFRQRFAVHMDKKTS